MLEQIRENLRKRMAQYSDSRQPTNDEAVIAWLISEIDRLKERIKRNKL